MSMATPILGELLHYALIEGLGLATHDPINRAHARDKVPMLH